MQTLPHDQIKSLLEAGKPALLARKLDGDLQTSVSAYLRLSAGETYSFLLESVEGAEQRARYSILGLAPDVVWRVDGNSSSICRNPDAPSPVFEASPGAPLDVLRALLAESALDIPDALPAMAAGIVGYMGYDMVRQMETLSPARPAGYDAPTALFIRPTIMAVFDNVMDQITLCTPIRPGGQPAEQLIERAEDRLRQMLDRLGGPLPLSARGYETGEGGIIDTSVAAPTPHVSEDRYRGMVQAAKDYILSGDIFQVVLAQRFSADFPLPPFHLFRALRRTNPSPYMFFLNFGDLAVVGSSPEILVTLRDEEVTIRPIAGTRKRGATPQEDAALEQELLGDAKELSEHLMLLDLGRNDVGRVAQTGSVRVTARNTVERYSHVMHIVSNVVGRLSADTDAIDALSAGFPAGTVSGAPKIRAMEIIDTLEPEGRGIYAGSVGYFSASGDMDTCIVLRTAVVKDGRMHVTAGAGIVADSDPAAEQKECENKAQALFSAAAAATLLDDEGRPQ